MGKRVMIGLGIAVLVVAAAVGGFFYGNSVGQARANQARQQLAQQRFGGQGGQFPDQTPQPGRGGGAGPGGGIMGTIEAIEGDTLVVKTQQGTVRVRTSETTFIEKYKAVGLEELETGEQVMVVGSQDESGNITARSIQSLRGFRAVQPEQTPER
jgi:hypothetical protein